MTVTPSPNRTRLRRTLCSLAMATVATTAVIVAGAGAAQADSSASIRLAPFSNPFLTVEVVGASSAAGANVDQWTHNGGYNQVWLMQPYNSHYRFVNKQSGLCLASDGVAGDTVFQWYCSSDVNEQWDTNLVAGNTVGYSIRNVGSNLYLEVRGGSGWAGADIDTWYWNGGNNQFFLGTSA
jgi:hypothetical protein